MIAAKGNLEEDWRAATKDRSPDDRYAAYTALILTGLACQHALSD